MSHHTKEQIQAAFARAPEVLEQLQKAGIPYPAFELYADASGRLRLGWEDEGITGAQLRLAQDLVRSVRPYQMMCPICFDTVRKHESYAKSGMPQPVPHKHYIGVTFCCGLVPEEMHKEGV